MVKSVNALINRKAYRSNTQLVMYYFGMNVLKKIRNNGRRTAFKRPKTFILLHFILES